MIRSIPVCFCLASVAVVLAACGEDQRVSHINFGELEASSDDFEALVRLGTRANYSQPEQVDSSYFYTSYATANKVVRLERDEASHAIASISYDTNLMKNIKTGQLKSAALDYISDNQEELGLDPGELKLAPRGLVYVGRMAVVTYKRFVDGLPVKDASVQLRFHKRKKYWRLASIQNRSFGRFQLNKAVSSYSDLDVAHQTGVPDMTIMGSSELVFVKKNSKGYDPVHAIEYELQDPATKEYFHLIVDAESGEMLEAQGHHVHAKMNVRSLERSYLFANDMIEEPLSFVAVNGQELSPEGEVGSLNGAANISLQGSKFSIHEGSQIIRFSVTPSGEETLVDTSNSTASLGALNTSAALSRVQKFAETYLDLSRLQPVKVNINYRAPVGGATDCNAFYIAQYGQPTINLFPQSSRCGNMALINDVIYHEWGHRLDDALGPQAGITDGAFSEGIGDIIASYLTNDHNMSPGFKLNDGNGIRDVKNTKRYPDDQGEVHDEGLIIGGAFWDLRELMIARYGQTQGHDKASSLFFRHLEITDSYRNSYDSIISLDDNDGNPATPSPNFCLITEAFAGHGLATVDPNCVDKDAPAPIDPQVVASMKLALDDENSDGKAIIWAASSSADEYFVCLDTREDCESTKAKDIALVQKREQGGVYLFTSSEEITLGEGLALTLMQVDQDGELVGIKSLGLKKTP